MNVARFCPQCGSPIQPEAAFCMGCGARLPKSEVGAAASPNDDPRARAKAEYLRARELWTGKRLDEAETAYRRAIELDSVWPHPRYDLAMLLESRDRPKEEIAQLYESFVARAAGTASLESQVANARQRVAALRAPRPPASAPAPQPAAARPSGAVAGTPPVPPRPPVPVTAQSAMREPDIPTSLHATADHINSTTDGLRRMESALQGFWEWFFPPQPAKPKPAHRPAPLVRPAERQGCQATIGRVFSFVWRGISVLFALYWAGISVYALTSGEGMWFVLLAPLALIGLVASLTAGRGARWRVVPNLALPAFWVIGLVLLNVLFSGFR